MLLAMTCLIEKMIDWDYVGSLLAQSGDGIKEIGMILGALYKIKKIFSQYQRLANTRSLLKGKNIHLNIPDKTGSRL